MDQVNNQYIWIPKEKPHLGEGDFLMWLVLRTNESLSKVDYEDFFNKFSNDYMISTKTIYDSISSLPFDFTQLDDSAIILM